MTANNQLLEDFKKRMKIFHSAEDDNLARIVEASRLAIVRETGNGDDSDPAIRELILERSRYVYNDALEFFDDNFRGEIYKAYVDNALKAGDFDGEDDL